MKQALLYYACDGNDQECEATSPECPTWGAAQREARKAGWSIWQGGHWCPTHNAEMRK